MQSITRIVKKTTQPINPSRFFQALREVWTPTEGEKNLGLAISGGVDSMALASLCQSLGKLRSATHFNRTYKYIPFIVDHKAREGSSEEALLVSKRLKELLDVEPIILPLSWPDGIEPSDLSSFESDARRLRYQALGRACRMHGIRSLLVAHHADDSAETILTRLSRGAGAPGLQGIQRSAEVPECYGIYGVHRSGGGPKVIARDGDDLLEQIENFQTKKLDNEHIQIERGGVLVCRPLLPFTKDELIATCEAQGVQWVEDETNKDPTKTVRNAVRKLLFSTDLPPTLQPHRLLALAHRNKYQIEQCKEYALRLLRATYIRSLDLRTGTLSIQVPSPPPSTKWRSSTIHDLLDRNKAHFQYELRLALRRLVEVVSPLESVAMNRIGTATEIIFGSQEAPVAFTTAGVKFARSEEKLPCEHALEMWTKYNSRMPLSEGREAREAFKPAPAYVWTLTRVSYSSHEPLPIIPIKSEKEGSLFVKPSFPSNSFHLWDGRFWICVLNRTGFPLCIRPFTPADLKPFLTALDAKYRGRLRRMLKEIAPGDLRNTLPVIAFADEVYVNEGEGRVLALPSLGVGVKEWKDKLKWNLRYKDVSLRF